MKRPGLTTPSGRQTPILAYHAVSESVHPRFARYAVTPRELDEQLAWLTSDGRSFLTVSEYADALARPAGPPARAVVLTFDDGFRDFLQAALPVLQRHGATATLFVPTAHIGGTSRWLHAQGEGARPLLDWSELDEVRRAGVEIGGHGHTHPQLDRLSPADALHEVSQCRSLLEERLNTRVRTFAYPFGYHHAAARRAVREAGYDSACEMRHLMSSAADDPYALRRLLVPRGISASRFRALVGTPQGPTRRAIREVREVGGLVLRRLRTPGAEAS